MNPMIPTTKNAKPAPTAGVHPVPIHPIRFLARIATGAFLVSTVLVPPPAPGAETTASPPAASTTTPTSTTDSPRYQHRPPSRDGTGKFYLDREIAQVMGHQGAPWLERPERIDEERPDLLHDLLGLQPGMVVADIGAGTGYHAWRMAEKVGPSGRVYAVDIQPEMLSLLATNMARRSITNVFGVLGTETDPKLPANTLDLALMVDVYHEVDHPHEMLAAISRALKPGGRVAFVEFRGEQASVPIKPLHKMTEAQVRREAEIHPRLRWAGTRPELPWQHLIFFEKTPESPQP
ncbi:MAG: class I SAM-dependent methyltransferase [Limisphaerales bacterium]